jgi:hypothetical protein
MSGVMQDGVPWQDALALGPDGPTNGQVNARALAPASRQHGYCLCMHPFQTVIDFTGLGCQFCLQPVTADSASEAARQIRTQAILAVWPELGKQE